MKADFNQLLKKTSEMIMENLPTLAARGAVVGTVTSVLLMHDADKKAHEIIKKKKPKTKKEKLKITWPCYIATITSTGITIGLILVSDNMWRNKYLLMSGAYEITKKAYDDYREETRKEVGDKKENDIHKAATENTINTLDSGFDERFISRCGWGNTLFVESSTGQLIIGNKESIKEVYNKLNHRMISSYGDPEISLTDLCSEFGLRYVTGASERGWNANYTGLIEPKFNRVIHINGDPDLPATVIEYYQEAKDNFGRDLFV